MWVLKRELDLNLDFIFIDSLVSADCPASSTVTTCTPKCKEDHECASTGGKCCPNLCNARSCYLPKANSKGTDKC